MNQDNQGNIGQFICELRKSGHMTQKELAEKLHITDKAVSKWERGLSCPDITLLPPLADILGVTAGELLRGKKQAHQQGEGRLSEPAGEMEEVIGNALQYAGRSAENRCKALQNIMALVFSLLLLAGIITCSICDMAITGSFTWSLFPISSIVLAWLVFFPAIKFGRKGVGASMAALTIGIFPFLYVLSRLRAGNALFLSIGLPMAIIGVVFLWVVFGLFRMLKKRKCLAATLSLLLVIPTNLLINAVLAPLIGEPLLDVWDILTFSIVGAAAIFLFVMDAVGRRKAR